MSGPSASATLAERGELATLLQRAQELEAGLLSATVRTGGPDAAEQSELRIAAQRLKRSVIRPMGAALERMPHDGNRLSPESHLHEHGQAPPADGADAIALLVGEPLWQLAQDATRLRVSRPLPPEVQEATAALQDLACGLASDQDADAGAARLAELRAIQAQLPCTIESQPNGPYLVTNAETLVNWLGERLATRPQMALCRCGASATKPFCDGTHAEIAFTSEKDAKRVADRRDTYVGQQVTILDNRGTCQHSGLCTDRLATVFHLGEEPFVTPSGGRMDEIIRAVRDCPSGALSYAIDGEEARNEVDYHRKRAPMIEVSRDGPYRVSGGIRLQRSEGEDEPQNDGASSEHYALCRCGHSQNKPFCSGMHWCGGLPALTRMTRLFYEKYVPQDPLLAPLFAEMSADHPQRVAKWLAEVFCGPKDYSEEYGGSLLVMSIAFFAMQQHMLFAKQHLLCEQLTPELRQRVFRRNAVGLLPYTVATLGGVVTPYLTLAICAVVAVFYGLPSTTSDVQSASS